MKALETLYEKQSAGVAIKSPALGYLSHLPEPDQIVNSDIPVGRLKILGNTYQLYLPDHLEGRVVNVESQRLLIPVAYEDNLFTLAPITTTENQTTAKSSPQAFAATSGQITITASSDGVFYGRPAPDALPYVQVGSVVKTGQVLGLVEVMKCFTQITFTGAHLPPEAKVVEVCARDGQEVKYQQVLFVLG